MGERQVSVHRCRFVDVVPHAIEWIDFAQDGELLAVLRANADIEIWRPVRGAPPATAPLGSSSSSSSAAAALPAGWYCETRIAGVIDTPVRRLAFGAAAHSAGRSYRLFSCGLHGMLTEWDLRRRAAAPSGPPAAPRGQTARH